MSSERVISDIKRAIATSSQKSLSRWLLLLLETTVAREAPSSICDLFLQTGEAAGANLPSLATHCPFAAAPAPLFCTVASFLHVLDFLPRCLLVNKGWAATIAAHVGWESIATRRYCESTEGACLAEFAARVLSPSLRHLCLSMEVDAVFEQDADDAKECKDSRISRLQWVSSYKNLTDLTLRTDYDLRALGGLAELTSLSVSPFPVVARGSHEDFEVTYQRKLGAEECAALGSLVGLRHLQTCGFYPLDFVARLTNLDTLSAHEPAWSLTTDMSRVGVKRLSLGPGWVTLAEPSASGTAYSLAGWFQKLIAFPRVDRIEIAPQEPRSLVHPGGITIEDFRGWSCSQTLSSLCITSKYKGELDSLRNHILALFPLLDDGHLKLARYH